MRVLVVEDEKKLASFMRKSLQEAGMTVDVCHDGDQGLHLVEESPWDAVVLDIMLPGRDGLSILRRLRAEKNPVPVILVSARADVPERIEGLNLGADDYLVKPFSTGELVARLRAVCRRSGETRFNLLKVSDLTLNQVTREVARAGAPIELAPREFTLLEFLMRSPGRVQTRTQICEHVWEYHFDPGTNLVDVYIQRLRRKIDDGHEQKLLQTIRGVGYTLREP